MRKIIIFGLSLSIIVYGFAFAEPLKRDRVSCSPMSASQNHLRPQSINTNIVYVKKNQTIQDVIDSITDESSFNQYIVKAPPGHEDDVYTDVDYISVEFVADRVFHMIHKSSYICAKAIHSIAFWKDYAILGRYGGLDIINISDLENPASETTILPETNDWITYDIKCVADYCVFIIRASTLDPKVSKIYVYDISDADPENWSETGSLQFDDACVATGMDLVGVPGQAGCYAYIANNLYHPSGSVFTIVDLSDDTDPSVAGQLIATSIEPHRVVVEGNYAYCGSYSRGMDIIDISVPATPTKTGSVLKEGVDRIWDVIKLKSSPYLYSAVARTKTSDLEGDHYGIVVYDVSNVSAPERLRYCSIPFNMLWGDDGPIALPVERSPQHLCCIDEKYLLVDNHQLGVAVFDIETKDNPIFIGNWRGGDDVDIYGTYNIAHHRNIVLIGTIRQDAANPGSSNNCALHIYEIKTPLLNGQTINANNRNLTFSPTDGTIFKIDPQGGNINFDPSGTFTAWTEIIVINAADAAETITFDSTGLNQAIAQNERGIFTYDGSNWLKVYVGS